MDLSDIEKEKSSQVKRLLRKRKQIRLLETGLSVIEIFTRNITSLLIIINLELDIIYRNNT